MDKEYNTNFIDFDYASSCWRANKKYLGKGIFTYKCNHISKTTNKYCTLGLKDPMRNSRFS